jgi:hypothetical protein
MIEWFTGMIAAAVVMLLTGQSGCKYRRRCNADNCRCWDDEQKRRRADLDRQERQKT